jgi:flagellar biosynthesis/type III secretory pathway chaperone
MADELNILFNNLFEQIKELRDLHEQLLLAVRSKQKAMREGNMSGLESWSAREEFLTKKIQEVDDLRSRANTELGKFLGFERSPKLSELAEKLPEPQRSKLLAIAGILRETSEKIRRANQVNEAVTREILNCYAQARQKMAAVQCDIGLYDPRGQKKLTRNISILDAVG